VIVINVPAPRLDDDLNCPPLGFPEWEVVEVHGVPQPGAWAGHPKGSSYEEFLCAFSPRHDRMPSPRSELPTPPTSSHLLVPRSC